MSDRQFSSLSESPTKNNMSKSSVLRRSSLRDSDERYSSNYGTKKNQHQQQRAGSLRSFSLRDSPEYNDDYNHYTHIDNNDKNMRYNEHNNERERDYQENSSHRLRNDMDIYSLKRITDRSHFYDLQNTVVDQTVQLNRILRLLNQDDYLSFNRHKINVTERINYRKSEYDNSKIKPERKAKKYQRSITQIDDYYFDRDDESPLTFAQYSPIEKEPPKKDYDDNMIISNYDKFKINRPKIVTTENKSKNFDYEIKADKTSENNEDNDSIKDYYQQKPKQNLPLFIKHHLNLINEESESSRMSSEQPCSLKNLKTTSKEDLNSDDKLSLDDILDSFKKSFREKAMSLETSGPTIRKQVDIEPKKVELVKLEPLSFESPKIETDEQIVPEIRPISQIDKIEIVIEKKQETPKIEPIKEPSPVKLEVVPPVESKPVEVIPTAIAENPKVEPKQNAVHKRFPLLLKKVIPKEEPKMKQVVNQVMKKKIEKIEAINKSPTPESKKEEAPQNPEEKAEKAPEQPKKIPKFAQQRSLDIPKKVDTSFIKKVEPKQPQNEVKKQPVAPVFNKFATVKPQQQPAQQQQQQISSKPQEQKVEPVKKPENEKPKKRVSTPQFYLEKYIAVYLESLQ